MRTLLLTGPGGAGTSTLAAATAVRAAAAGSRTLLLTRPGPRPAGLDGVPGLAVASVSPLAAAESLWTSAGGAATVIDWVDWSAMRSRLTARPRTGGTTPTVPTHG